MKKRINHIIKNHWEFIVFSFALFGLILYSSNHVFFWDTVQLGARHATFYFNNDFKLAFLPNQIDSGHIPTFGYLLALCWVLFGKTLLVSHLFIFPFAVGIVWQLKSLCNKLFERKAVFWVLLVLLMDTTFLSQVSLVSPDIPLLFFFLFGLNSIFYNKRIAIAIAFSGLFLVSMRGMILTVPLFLFDAYLNGNINFKNLKKSLVNLIKIGVSYIPAALIFIGYNWLHYSQKGWIGYHSDSPWAVFFEKVDVSGAIKNTFIFGWRLVDFGRIGIWIILLVLLVKRKNLKAGKHTVKLLILAVLILGFLSIPAIIYLDLKGHRYFMPIYFAVSLLATYVIFNLVESKKLQKIGIGLMIISLFSGSFWVYPDSVAQGWDSTLGHLPYYSLRSNMIKYIEENNISKESIGYDFPGGYEQRFLDLSNKTWFFPEVDLRSQEYILFSNVVNEFTDIELEELKEKWKPIHEEKSITVNMILYKRM